MRALSPRGRMLLGFGLSNLAVLAVALTLLLGRQTPPHIQGILLQPPRPLEPFVLLDQHSQLFSNANLLGRWHLVAYGFTTCPDVCPTTLARLAQVAQLLDERGQRDLEILFYSIDYRRDTPAQLAAYLPFFDPGFIGLTHDDDPDNRHLAFERSLGMVARISATDPGGEGADTLDYQVSHGTELYLLNPAGQLQAVLRPGEGTRARPALDPQQVVRDILAIRSHLG